mmetsp:Transcript_13675/g.23451  ORF Transcript_13675/g.23451 Transcript_13675/m.23451 type:complete len:111 (+) Transcript_13675:16-348(+)
MSALHDNVDSGSSVSASAVAPSTQRSLVEDVFDAILTPGVGPGVLRFLNKVFIFLFASIAFMWFAGVQSVHVYILLFLSTCLFVLINWFMSEIASVQASSTGEAIQKKTE